MRRLIRQRLKFKVTGSVAVADVSNYAANPIEIVRQQSRLHFASKQVAQNTAKIFMARIRKERATIGQHSNK